MSRALDDLPGRRPGGPGGRRSAASGTLLVLGLVALLTTFLPGGAACPTEAAASGATTAPAAPAAPGDTGTGDPIELRITSLSPAVAPQRGPVTVTGTVTNRTARTAEGVNVYAVASEFPMTTSTEIADAAESAPDTFIGDRIVTDARNQFGDIGPLRAGSTRSFRIQLPRELLPAAGDGVYWFGLQALATTETGAREIVGRARTFLPAVDTTGPDSPRVDAAILQPLRHPVRRDAEGRVRNLTSWAQGLAPGGRLDRLLDFGAEAEDTGSTPLTWIVDPAVPDTVAELQTGNPGLSIAPTIGPEPPEPDAPSGEGSPSESSDLEGSTQDVDELDEPQVDPVDAAALDRLSSSGGPWLRQLRSVLGRASVLALPYGDLDVDAALRHTPSLYERARIRTAEVMAGQGLEDYRPAVAPPSGLLDPATLAELSSADTVVLADRALDRGQAGVDETSEVPTTAVVEDRAVVLGASGVADGGPGPEDPLTEVAVRQRLLSEAAVRAVAAGGEGATLVATLPEDWQPASGTGFFRELADVAWLEVSDLPDVVESADAPDPDGGQQAEDREEAADSVPADALSYPEEARELEPGRLVLGGARRLGVAAATLQDVLPLNDTVAAAAVDEALVGLSYGNRAEPEVAATSVTQARRHVEGMLGQIDIRTPTELTLSSEAGDFSVTVANGLPQPVVVRLRAVTDGLVRITAPERVEVAAESVTTVPMNASSTRRGLAVVDVEVTDSNGNATGSSSELPIRSVVIGNVIWWVLGVGTLLLAVAIVLRLVRRVRATRSATAG